MVGYYMDDFKRMISTQFRENRGLKHKESHQAWSFPSQPGVFPHDPVSALVPWEGKGH